MTGYQLALELGAVPSTPVAREDENPVAHTLDLAVVVCELCTGRHPVERCPSRRVCAVCTSTRHVTASHSPEEAR